MSVYSLAYTWACRLLAGLLIVASVGLRIFYLASDSALDLAPDEAHYWDWSRHLDWSYYSKGPLVACLIRSSLYLNEGWTTAWAGNAMLAVRLPAILCGALVLVGLYTLTVQVFRRDGLALAVVALAITIPTLAAGSTLITIDAPYTCLWTWALVFAYQALFRQSKWAWPAAGLMIALGILAKYTMILFVPFLFLFLLFTPGFRRTLWQPGLWVMLAVGALGGVPILIWNIQHDWVSLRHIGGHAGVHQAGPHWLGPLNYLGGQAAILIGYWFVVFLIAIWAYRPWRESRTDLRFLWWMSAPMFLFFLAFSLKNGGGEANWPVTAYLAGLVLAVAWLSQQIHSPVTWWRVSARCWLVGMASIGLALTLFVHYTRAAYPLLAQIAGPVSDANPLPLRRLDPTCRLQGWRTLAAEVDRIRTRLAAEGKDPVIACGSWHQVGEVGFYAAGHPEVFCLGPIMGERYSQYDLWRPNPVADSAKFLGKTFIMVAIDPAKVKDAFASIEPAIQVEHRTMDQPVNHWVVYIGHDFRGFSTANQTRRY